MNPCHLQKLEEKRNKINYNWSFYNKEKKSRVCHLHRLWGRETCLKAGSHRKYSGEAGPAAPKLLYFPQPWPRPQSSTPACLPALPAKHKGATFKELALTPLPGKYARPSTGLHHASYPSFQLPT